MSKIVIPKEQNLYPNPNAHVNFEFENSIEEYRTSRYINNILKVFGPDVLLWGLNLHNVDVNDITHLFTFNEGALIQDSTLVRILNSFSKSIDIPTDYYSEYTHPQTGVTIPNSIYSVVLLTEFKYQVVTEIPTVKPNQVKIHIGLLNRNSHELYNNKQERINIDPTKHRMVLYAASIDNLYYLHNEVNIDNYIYEVPGTIKIAHTFEYEKFNFDGGVIDIC